MSLNLVQLVTDRFDGPVMEQISNTLGIEQSGAKSAIQGAIPAVIAGMMDKASTTEGADSLLSSLKDLGREDDLLENLPSLISGGGHESLSRAGGNFMKSLFGDKIDSISESLGGLSGIGGQSAGSLFNMVTPVAVGVLGKQQHSLGLDAGGLSRLLSEQKDAVAGAMPKEMLGSLDFDNLDLNIESTLAKAKETVLESTNTAADKAATAAGYDPDQPAGSGGTMRTIIIIAVLAIVTWLVYDQFFAAPPPGGETTG